MVLGKFYICSVFAVLISSFGFMNICAAQNNSTQESEMIIFLIRHARPDVPEIKSANYDEMVKYYYLYDSVDIMPFDKKIVLDQIDEDVPEIILTSTLPRAKQTAKLAFGEDVKYVHKSVFNEFGRTIVNLPSVTLPKGFWSGFSRLTWAMGFNQKSESFKNARKRAELCAGILEDIVIEEDIVILVGHGFMNHYIKRELKRSGWEIEINDGKKNLGVIKMVKYH